MPVEFTVGVWRETHVYAGHGRCDGEDFLVLLTRPAGVLVAAEAVVREAHWPHCLGDVAFVGEWGRVDV